MKISVRTVDTAATVLWLLGLTSTTEWTGVPVRAAFVERAQVTADQAAAGRHREPLSLPTPR